MLPGARASLLGDRTRLDRIFCDARVATCTRRLHEKGVAADEKGVGPLTPKSCEGRSDLTAGPGVEDLDLQPHGAGSRFHVSQRGFDGNIRRNWFADRSL